MILRILAGSIVALGLGFYAEGVRAEQTFMCEDGRLLQVRLQDLERLKRQEPCVAGHYGLVVQHVPLPVKRPARPSEPVLKGAKAPEPTERPVGAMAQATSDYRHVRIINARPGSPVWYTHKR